MKYITLTPLALTGIVGLAAAVPSAFSAPIDKRQGGVCVPRRLPS